MSFDTFFSIGPFRSSVVSYMKDLSNRLDDIMSFFLSSRCLVNIHLMLAKYTSFSLAHSRCDRISPVLILQITICLGLISYHILTQRTWFFLETKKCCMPQEPYLCLQFLVFGSYGILFFSHCHILFH